MPSFKMVSQCRWCRKRCDGKIWCSDKCLKAQKKLDLEASKKAIAALNKAFGFR